MFVIPGIAALLLFMYLRPHEVFEWLHWVTMPLVVAVVVVGYLVDLRAGVTRTRLSALMISGLAFFAWLLLTIIIRAPDSFLMNLPVYAVPAMLFLAPTAGIASFRAVRVVAAILLGTTLLLGSVGVHQGLSPKVCVDDSGETGALALPGIIDESGSRRCETRADCQDVGEKEFRCEHLGLFRTYSVGGRVRFRGVFQDPNELAWAMATALPLTFLWFESRRSGRRALVLVLVLAVCITCSVLTKSRSGQISLAITATAYFIRRLGWRGVLLAALLSLPVLLWGGRSDAGADASTEERLECWAEALSIWRDHPFLGVGGRQFTEYHYLTAHNSFLLVLAELGPFGLFLWTATLYFAFKLTVQVQRDFANRPDAAAALNSAFAMSAALVGFVGAALFLSIAYHPGIWIHVGLVGAIQSAVWRHEPRWRLRWHWWEMIVVALIDVAVVSALAVYLRFKGL